MYAVRPNLFVFGRILKFIMIAIKRYKVKKKNIGKALSRGVAATMYGGTIATIVEQLQFTTDEYFP